MNPNNRFQPRLLHATSFLRACPIFAVTIYCLWINFPAQAEQRRVVAIAHRGEHIRNPENTLPAFAEAIRVGADFIEVDVRTTKDGKLVLSHDGKVDRRTNGQGEVSKMTFDEVRALDAGIKSGPEFAHTKVPTFDEALDMARGKIGIYVDVKQASAKDLVEHIDGHGMTEHVVIYAGLRLSKEIQALNPKLKVMPESDNVETINRLIAELHPKVIAFGARDWKPEIIRLAKEAHAEVYVDRMGPTDNPEGWQTAIDEGADGIQTDRPGELVKYLREKGYKPSP
jgi:glycerophosphoryl diester phosphodiesterase